MFQGVWFESEGLAEEEMWPHCFLLVWWTDGCILKTVLGRVFHLSTQSMFFVEKLLWM